MINTVRKVSPLFDEKLRDTYICADVKGVYYLCGTIGDDAWDHNDGIKLWMSNDGVNWTSLGLVWSFEKDATWQNEPRYHKGKKIRSVWAPELHYINNNFYIPYSIPPGGTGILKSVTGKVEGPYVNALAEDRPLTDGIDATLFQDDDGTVYFLFGGGFIARMNENMTALAEEPRRLVCDTLDPDPAHHGSKSYAGMDEIGFEGPFMFKHNGRYYLSCAEFYEGRYSSMAAYSDNIYGPYCGRFEALPCGGHNNYFKGIDGEWYGTMFGNDRFAPFKERPAMIKMQFDDNGIIKIKEDQFA